MTLSRSESLVCKNSFEDAMPPMPAADVERILAEELGPRWRERVTIDLTAPPLGSATIAQVNLDKFKC